MVKPYAVIENGVVTNIAVAEEDFALEHGWVLLPYGVFIGWLYDGSSFSPPLPLEPDRSTMTLTFAQLMIGLVTEAWITEAEGDAWLVGTLPAVFLALIATLPTEEQFPARARAIRPSSILRMDPLVMALSVAQGKTPEQIDQFFQTYAQV